MWVLCHAEIVGFFRGPAAATSPLPGASGLPRECIKACALNPRTGGACRPECRALCTVPRGRRGASFRSQKHGLLWVLGLTDVSKAAPALKGLGIRPRKGDVHLGTANHNQNCMAAGVPGPRGQAGSWGTQWMTTLLGDSGGKVRRCQTEQGFGGQVKEKRKDEQ